MTNFGRWTVRRHFLVRRKLKSGHYGSMRRPMLVLAAMAGFFGASCSGDAGLGTGSAGSTAAATGGGSSVSATGGAGMVGPGGAAGLGTTSGTGGSGGSSDISDAAGPGDVASGGSGPADTGSDRGPARDGPEGVARSFVYVSGYDAPITIFGLNPTPRVLTPAGTGTTGAGGEPTSLAFSPDKRVLYAGDEQKDKPASHVIAFSIDPTTGALAEINRQDTGSTSLAHVGVHPSVKRVLSANYGTSNDTVVPFRPNSSLL